MEKEIVAHSFKAFANMPRVSWYSTKFCNFACTYCCDYLHGKTPNDTNWERMKTVVDNVYKYYGTTKVMWSFTGGEPTLNPHLLDTFDYMKSIDPDNFISVLTNGSKPVNYFIDLLPKIDALLFSLHMEYVGKRVEDYLNKAIMIEGARKKMKNPPPVKWRFLLHPKYFDEIKFMIEEMEALGIKNIDYRHIHPLTGSSKEILPEKKVSYDIDIEATPQEELLEDLNNKAIKTTEECHYTPEQEAWIIDRQEGIDNWHIKMERWFDDGTMKRRYSNSLVRESESNFNNWLCWAGKQFIKIAPNGDVYVGTCHVGGKRGNILDLSTLDLPKEPLRCPKQLCWDHMDLQVPKAKDWQHVKHIRHALMEKHKQQVDDIINNL